LGDIAEFFVLVHGCLAQQRVGVGFADVFHVHENALGAFDDFALAEFAARAIELLLQARKRVEASGRRLAVCGSGGG
jgi:hypothetical protein